MFLISFINSSIYEIGTFPSDWKLSIRQPIADAVKALTVHPGFIGFTKGLRAFVYLNLLHPLDVFLTHIPWWFTMAIFVAIGYFTVGLRFAFITALLLLFIGACGIWSQSMITLSSVLVSVFLCFALGVPLGIIASYNDRFRNIQMAGAKAPCNPAISQSDGGTNGDSGNTTATAKPFGNNPTLQTTGCVDSNFEVCGGT